MNRHEDRHRDDEPELARLVMKDAHAAQRAEGAGDGGEEERPLGDPALAQPGAPLIRRIQDEDREVRDGVGDQEWNGSDQNQIRLDRPVFCRSAWVDPTPSRGADSRENIYYL